MREQTVPTYRERFFRCPVADDQKEGCLKFGWGRIFVLVDETSIDGFTIRLPDTELGRIPFGKSNWVLEHFGERSSVKAEWFLHHSDGVVQLGLRRLADLTPLPATSSGFRTLISVRGIASWMSACSEIWLGCAALIVIGVLTLPGLGDHLGTAPRIRQGSSVLLRSFDGFFTGLFSH